MDKMGRIGRNPHFKKRYHGFGGDSHRVLKFKQFVIMREDEISPERAGAEYARYLSEFLNNEIGLYYDTYEHLPFFREKYHPYYLQEEHKLRRDIFLYKSRQFFQDYESGKYRNLLLEISFRRLYGKIGDCDSNIAETSYGYKEWAYEIPLEYPNDGAHCQRLPLKSPLESVILADVPDKVFKYEIVSALKSRIDNFTIYMAERDKVRTAFISVDGCTNLKTLADELNNDRLTVQEFLLRFDPCNPLQERIRIRVCPPICSHPLIKLRDVELTRKLAKKLDSEMGSSDNYFVDLLPEDLDVTTRLDLQLMYLRVVHNYCYYGRIKGQGYIDLWDLGGPGHVRVDLTNDLYSREDGITTNNVTIKYASWDIPKCDKMDNCEGIVTYSWEEQLTSSSDVSPTQIQWLKDVESFAKNILDKDLLPPEYMKNSAEIEERWKQFCNLNTVVDGPERFRCRLCHKLFNDTKFVCKHLKLKHGDNYDKIIVECGLEQMKDIFFTTHRDSRCNPFEHLVSVPILQKPSSDFDKTTREFYGKSDGQFNNNVTRHNGSGFNKKRRKEYFDFDRPYLGKKLQTVAFVSDEYSRPTVKYDDL